MKFNELKTELDNGNTRNLYIFTGPEREVMNRYIKRVSGNVQRAQSFESIIPHLTTNNLFSPKQTYLIEDDKSATEREYQDIQLLVGKNTVIFVYKDIDKRKKLFKSAKDNIVEFERFNEQQLIWFVQKEIDVDDRTAAMIASYSGNDVARIQNECDKLNQLGKEITDEIVKELIHPPVEDRIFDMMDFLAKKKRAEAFKIYYDLIELKTSPIQIVALLYTKFKQLFLVQSYFKETNQTVAGKTGLTFFQVNLTRPLVGAFTAEQIVEHLRKIQLIEVKIKTGQVEQFTAMESLLVDILR